MGEGGITFFFSPKRHLDFLGGGRRGAIISLFKSREVNGGEGKRKTYVPTPLKGSEIEGKPRLNSFYFFLFGGGRVLRRRTVGIELFFSMSRREKYVLL